MALLDDFYRSLSKEALQKRFHCAFAKLSDERVRQFTLQSMANSSRHLMLVATATRVNDGLHVEDIVAQAGWVVGGVEREREARFIFDAQQDDDTAEFGIVVTDRFQNLGIGSRLMRQLVAGAALRRLSWLRASVVQGNASMLAVMRAQGLWCSPQADEEGVHAIAMSIAPNHASCAWSARPRHRRWLGWLGRRLGRVQRASNVTHSAWQSGARLPAEGGAR